MAMTGHDLMPKKRGFILPPSSSESSNTRRFSMHEDDPRRVSVCRRPLAIESLVGRTTFRKN